MVLDLVFIPAVREDMRGFRAVSGIMRERLSQPSLVSLDVGSSPIIASNSTF